MCVCVLTGWRKKISQEGPQFHYKSFSGGGCARQKENEGNFVCLPMVPECLNTMAQVGNLYFMELNRAVARK